MRSQFAIILAAIVLAALGFAGFKIRREFNEAGYRSCLASLMDPILAQDAAKELASESPDWLILSDADFDRVMPGVKGTDCGGYGDPKLDLYGTRINIALRERREGRWPPIIVWSNGADLMAGTDDDIVEPHGQVIPK